MPLPLVARAARALFSTVSGRRSTVGRFVGQLRAGDLYRVWVRDQSGLTRSFHREGMQERLFRIIAQKLESARFSPVLLVVQDPSDVSVLTAIARWGGGTEVHSPEGLEVFHIEPVAEPEESFVSPPSAPSSLLDLGLTAAEESAIRYALSEDENPKHLSGFADTLEPDFPIASGLLGAKAKLAELRGLGALVRPERASYAWEMRRRLLAPIGWREEPEKSGAIAALESASEGLTPKNVWSKYEGDFPPPVRSSWALGEAARNPASDASVAVVLPTGAARSPTAEKLALNAFRDLHFLAPGNSLDEQAGAYLAALGRTKGSIKETLVSDLSARLSPRASTLPIVRGVLARLRAEPDLLKRYPIELSLALNVPEVVSHAALASARDLAMGIVLVDADVLRGLDPADEGRGRPFFAAAQAPSALVNTTAGAVVSPSALQLAYSSGRPTLSNVLRVPVARARIRSILKAAQAGNPQALRAKASLDRAQKLLQRQKWVSWYDRADKVESSPRAKTLTGPLQR